MPPIVSSALSPTAAFRPKIMTLFRREVRKRQYVSFISEFHLQMIADAGGIPVAVPMVRGIEKMLPIYMNDVDGLLMVEGDDISPTFHKHVVQETLHMVRDSDPLKDEAEFRMAKHAIRNKMPILGICRGSQLLNLVAGGQLYNDVQLELPTQIDHRTTSSDEKFEHKVTLVQGTPLWEWYDKKSELYVNSYHHQGVRKLAKRFSPLCHSEDGLIEGFYDPKAPFVMGLQFHPERMLREYDGNKRVYQHFVAACRSWHMQYRTPVVDQVQFPPTVLEQAKSLYSSGQEVSHS